MDIPKKKRSSGTRPKKRRFHGNKYIRKIQQNSRGGGKFEYVIANQSAPSNKEVTVGVVCHRNFTMDTPKKSSSGTRPKKKRFQGNQYLQKIQQNSKVANQSASSNKEVTVGVAMPMSPKERMQVYRKRLKGLLPPSPLRTSAQMKGVKERQRAKLASLSNDNQEEMPDSSSGQESAKNPTTDRPFIAVIKSKTNDAKEEVSDSESSEESDKEPASKAASPVGNKYALPSPYKNLPSVSVCLKEEDRILAQRELGRTLQRTSSISSNGSNDVTKPSLPVTKRKRVERPAPKVTGRKNDCYCWVCHRENVALSCIGCPRAYHFKCAGEFGDSSPGWVCPECHRVLRAEAVDTQSSVLSEISLDKLCSLLKFSLTKLKQRGGAPFHQPVSFEHFPMYPHYVIHPMDFSLLEKNIMQKLYGSTEAFLSDVKWILHNSCVFNGAQHPLSNNAKSVVKNCENDMQEIEVCPDCFMHSANRSSRFWFSEVCGKPHPLVWAKLKGFPYWPAKVVRILDGNVDARFFGAHDRAWVPVNQCYHLSKDTPTSSKPKKKGNYEVALSELNVHVHLLMQKFGTFEYAPYRQVFDPTNKTFMYHGIDIDKISKEEIPVDTTSLVTSEMYSTPMDVDKSVESKTTPDSVDTLSKNDESNCESGKASPKDEADRSVDLQKKLSLVDQCEAKDGSEDGNAQKKESYESTGLNKIQKVLEKIKGIVSNNDGDESEEAEKDEPDELETSVEPQKASADTDVKEPEGSIIAGLIKSKSLPSLDIPIPEDMPEEPPVNILAASNRNDSFSLKLIETIESCKAKLGISELNESMSIESEEEDEEEMEQDSEEENSGSEESGKESGEEDSEESSEEESDTDIEEVDITAEGSEKVEEKSSSVENDSEKTDERCNELLKNDRDSNDVSEIVESIAGKKGSTEKGSLAEKQVQNTDQTDEETDDEQDVLDEILPVAQNEAGNETVDKSLHSSKEQEGSPTGQSVTLEGSQLVDSDDDIFICDPPPKPPTPPLICLEDEGTDEEPSQPTDKEPEEELRQLEVAARKVVKMPQNARKSIKRVVRRLPSDSSDDDDEEEEVPVVPPRVSLSGAKRTFQGSPPTAKRARADIERPSPTRDQPSRSAVEDENEELPERPFSLTIPPTNPSIENSGLVIDELHENEPIPEAPTDAHLKLLKVKKRLMNTHMCYKLRYWKFMQMKAELRHNMNLAMMEMRASLEADKRHALEAQSQAMTLDKVKAVEEAKRKQWCSGCLQESRYSCCWNTSYCTIACQKKHFPVHRKTCTQLNLKNTSPDAAKAGDLKKVVLLNMVPKSDASKAGTSSKQSTLQIPFTISQKSSQLPQSSIQFVSLASTSQSKQIVMKGNKITDFPESTDGKTMEEPPKPPELSLEERYFPSPPTVCFEGLDSALPDESVRFDEPLNETSDSEARVGSSSGEEDVMISDDNDTNNEIVSLGYGVELLAKYLNKCLIYGTTEKKLTRCLVDVIFPDCRLLANCSAFGNKSNLTKLTRAALPSKKVACIIDYVMKRFPKANKSDIVMAINLKCKEARALMTKAAERNSDGKKPVSRRLLAKEQEEEASASPTVVVTPKPPEPKEPLKPTIVSIATTSHKAAVVRQPPNIICVKKPPNVLQQRGLGMAALRKPTASLLRAPLRRESILARPQTPMGVRMGPSKILLRPLNVIHKKPGEGSEMQSNRPCIILGSRLSASKSANQKPGTSTPNKG